MPKISILLFVIVYFCGVSCQGDGSGTDGNLRLCVVEGRGKYRRAPKFCPVLEREGTKLECVVASDRLDCLRRMAKGTVDFGVFDPEDLVVAQWASVDLLVTNQLKIRSQMFDAEIACVVSRGFLMQSGAEGGPDVILRNSTLCHPGHGATQGLSDTLSDYLESLVTERSCEPSLSLAENRLLALSKFFRAACKPGPWLGDEIRDAQLKRLHPSLCAACSTGTCRKEDSYWGPQGSLNCLTEGAGDVTWASIADVRHRFGLNGEREALDDPRGFAYLCRDGTTQALTNNTRPCVWLNKPWPVIVAKRKSAEAVSRLQESLTNDTAPVGGGWRAALLSLLESHSALSEPLRPQQSPLDYLERARGFREAYSRSGCNPPRHISVCTASSVEANKCEWMSEAGSVYGVEPPLQCQQRSSRRECMLAVDAGAADATVAGADWLVTAQRDHQLSPILYESNPIVREMRVLVAYVRSDSKVAEMSDLKGNKAAFPSYDGVAWHSIADFVRPSREDCDTHDTVENYFGDLCVPGVGNSTLPDEAKSRLMKLCGDESAKMDGEELALKLLVEGVVDVAFVSMDSLAKYTGVNGSQPWSAKLGKNDTRIICPGADKTYCFFSWSSPGQVYVSSDLAPMRRQEMINAFQQLDQLFGKAYPFHTAAFSMYGPYGHVSDVMFHDNMKGLVTASKLRATPFVSWPRNYETAILPGALKPCAGSGATLLSPGVAMLNLVFILSLLRSSCL